MTNPYRHHWQKQAQMVQKRVGEFTNDIEKRLEKTEVFWEDKLKKEGERIESTIFR